MESSLCERPGNTLRGYCVTASRGAEISGNKGTFINRQSIPHQESGDSLEKSKIQQWEWCIDKETINSFRINKDKHLFELHEELKEGRYNSSPVKECISIK